jgi:hypothetical protein
MSKREPVADFSISPLSDVRATTWWKPRRVAVLGEPEPEDRLLIEFLAQLLAAFREQGHPIVDSHAEDVHLMLAVGQIPASPQPLAERIPERPLPLALTLMREFNLKRRPENLVMLVAVPERLSSLPHAEAAEIARLFMARQGVPKVVFVSGERQSGTLFEATTCTMEGGHPSDAHEVAQRVRDRLVTAACAHEVGADYIVEENGLAREAWLASPTPEALVEAGRRMDRLGLLPAPKRIGGYVSENLARVYERYLGMKGFSEGMLFAYDPGTQTMMVTASGSWEVDKRALRRDEVVAIGGTRDGKLVVLAPPGVTPKGPSVEALEMFAMLGAVPRVRLRQSPHGEWTPDPRGEVDAPIVRAGIHVHVGVESADPAVIETVPANRQLYPYGFGCGTDLMCGLAQDAARRARAINDPADPRAFVRWPMLYHGDTVLELWKPGRAGQPLEALLDLYDPAITGAIRYTPDHIHQPV